MEYQQIIAPPQSRALKSGRVSLGPGQEVGSHRTEDKEEIIVCIKGEPTLMIEKSERILHPGDAVFIKEDSEHNVINKTAEAAEYVYVVHRFKEVLK